MGCEDRRDHRDCDGLLCVAVTPFGSFSIWMCFAEDDELLGRLDRPLTMGQVDACMLYMHGKVSESREEERTTQPWSGPLHPSAPCEARRGCAHTLPLHVPSLGVGIRYCRQCDEAPRPPAKERLPEGRGVAGVSPLTLKRPGCLVCAMGRVAGRVRTASACGRPMASHSLSGGLSPSRMAG